MVKTSKFPPNCTSASGNSTNKMRVVLIWLGLLLSCAVRSSNGLFCEPGKKVNPQNTSCTTISTHDVLSAMKGLTTPPSTVCQKQTTVQGVPVCEDNFSPAGECNIVSIAMTENCDQIGDLTFEKYWGSRCNVYIYQMTTYMTGCPGMRGRAVDLDRNKNIKILRNLVWQGGCFNCVYKVIDSKVLPQLQSIDILKIQTLDRPLIKDDVYDGAQYTVMADLFLHIPQWMDIVKQLIFTASITSLSLNDNVGREAEHGWNMWASRMFIRKFASFASRTESGPFTLRPLQYDHLLSKIPLSVETTFYHHSLLRLQDNAQIEKNEAEFARWKPVPVPELHAEVPKYCTPPQGQADADMQRWIKEEMNVRCHPFRLAVPCDFSRTHEPFIPCQQELMDNLAEDYAAMKGWCDFNHASATIPALKIVDDSAAPAFQKPFISPTKDGSPRKVRLAFFFTVYSDAKYVKRLVSLLYGPDHYYLLHIDPTGASKEFEDEMRAEIATKYGANNNVFVSKDVPIVYGASTATIVLTKTMAWFSRFTTGWDYFVAVTGSDYPLMPLHRFERILAHQNPPMPFVMAWTPGTSTHLFRLQKTHPTFETDPHLAMSIDAVTAERGKLLGQVPMEYRSNNFGPPLFCNGQKTFYHLDNRQNKTGKRFDTQWLFPRDIFPKRGRAIAEETRAYATPSFDGQWRVWKKSDPATSAVYDRETIDYIINTEEGRKYYHYFKHMLLGSEEHYQVSLLYNWDRTRSFVQTLSAEMVWNTWILGLWENSNGFQTHTHFLGVKEFELLKGFAKRGMMFARKFSTKKNQDLIDLIDGYVHNNASMDAGLYWPGYFYTDITSPGKVWIAELRRNETIRAKREKKQRDAQAAQLRTNN